MSLAGLSACGSTTIQRVVRIDPAAATLYINGVKSGGGDSRPHNFKYANVDRIYVQAVHPEYKPEIQWFTLELMESLVDNDLPLKITLEQR
jgi:hypothetical protein